MYTRLFDVLYRRRWTTSTGAFPILITCTDDDDGGHDGEEVWTAEGDGCGLVYAYY